MEDKGALARAKFMEGYNCTQAVALAFASELNMDEKRLAKLVGGLGGGISQLREFCGALSGAVLVLSALYGYDDPKDIDGKVALYERVRALAHAFEESEGSYNCRRLLGLKDGETAQGVPVRDAQYYEKRPCPRLVEKAAELAQRYIEAHPIS